MTLQDLTPEMIQRFEAERKAKLAAIQADNDIINKHRATQQALVKAEVEAARHNQIHTAKKEYICEVCNHTIPIGTKYRRQTLVTGYGFPEGNHYESKITHVSCVGGKV
jgi:hypothetical protein